MLVLSAEQILQSTSLPKLIDSLQEAFCKQYVAPGRQLVSIPSGSEGRLLLFMPAFDKQSGAGAVKLSTVCPANPSQGIPTIQAVIVVFSANGTPVAVLDGTVVTRLRTGAASALASRYLSRTDSSHLVIIGTGALAPMMAAAHCAVRPITRISVCGRRPEKSNATVASIRSLVSGDIDVQVSQSTSAAVAAADIVSCSTSSVAPVLEGKWLRPGTFVDLVGSFSPAKRESDDEVVRRSRIFVDTIEGALTEAGDILDPLERGVIDRKKIEGELADLTCGRASGRRNVDEIILFKSVGTAIEDLAAAELVLSAATSAPLRRGYRASDT
jgi:alanine dehydrogenase